MRLKQHTRQEAMVFYQNLFNNSTRNRTQSSKLAIASSASTQLVYTQCAYMQLLLMQSYSYANTNIST